MGKTEPFWLGGEIGIAEPVWLSEPILAGALAAAGDLLAFPGLINSHDHLAFNCYPPTGKPPYDDFVAWSRDVQAEPALIATIEAIPQAVRVQFGLLKNLLWGVTAVADHGGAAAGDGPVAILAPYASLHSPEAERWGRLKLMAGSGPVVAHIGEGTTAQSRERGLSFLRWNLRHRRFAGVHAVSFRDADFARLAALIWCPASNLFLFNRTADVTTAARHTRLLFGTDSTLSAPGTLWDHLRKARGQIPDRALLAALTTTAAQFWNLPPTHWRDNFVIARRGQHDVWDAFFALRPADILLVVANGKIALADRSIADNLPLPDPVSAITWNEVQKFVPLPLSAMSGAMAEAAPGFDQAALWERLIEHSAAARAA